MIYASKRVTFRLTETQAAMVAILQKACGVGDVSRLIRTALGALYAIKKDDLPQEHWDNCLTTWASDRIVEQFVQRVQKAAQALSDKSQDLAGMSDKSPATRPKRPRSPARPTAKPRKKAS